MSDELLRIAISGADVLIGERNSWRVRAVKAEAELDTARARIAELKAELQGEHQVWGSTHMVNCKACALLEKK